MGILAAPWLLWRVLMALSRGNPPPIPTAPLLPNVEPTLAALPHAPISFVSAAKPFQDLRIHAWYTSVMAFPAHLVSSILDSFSPYEDGLFIDPHCGTGTSLVEAQRRGLKAFGIDANPSSVLASKVKTDWSVDLAYIRKLIESMTNEFDTSEVFPDDSIMAYLRNSGMFDRGWIPETTALQAVAIKRWIDRTVPRGPVYRFFMLSLIASVVRDLANVKFGPEIYCVPAPERLPDALSCITNRLHSMVDDLETTAPTVAVGKVRQGDSRDGRTMKAITGYKLPVYVVTSPPYPTEHDYTRNARLELIFMESVKDTESLRRIKKRMIRSHSKGIYAHDRDSEFVEHLPRIQGIKKEIERRIVGAKSGFEGQYPKVIVNYFGGMIRHFSTFSRYLPSGSRLAYVVGDEASYKGVHIPTAQILAEMIETNRLGLTVDELLVWRSRRTQGRQPLQEHVLFLRKQ